MVLPLMHPECMRELREVLRVQELLQLWVGVLELGMLPLLILLLRLKVEAEADVQTLPIVSTLYRD